MKLWFVFILLTFFGSLFWKVELFAQQSDNGSKQVKRQVIDFEDQLVEGDVSRSELLLLLQKKEY